MCYNLSEYRKRILTIVSASCLETQKNSLRNEVIELDLNMISYLAELGKLHFSPEEMEQMAKDMTSIIAIMDTVKEIDITYDAEADNKNVYLNDLREDVNVPCFPTEKILQNAVNDESCFVVPKVVE